METCSFRDWYETNEGWRDWLKQAGQAAMNWSPVNPRTIGTYPGKYVDAQGNEIPEAPDSAMQSQPRPMAQPMDQPMEPRRAARALGPVQQQVATRNGASRNGASGGSTGFKANDLLAIRQAIGDYVGVFKKFLHRAAEEVDREAVNDYTKNVEPYYKNLRSWRKWIDEMISWLPRKAESIEEENELITEAIKVSYKDFERLAGTIRALSEAAKKWLIRVVRLDPGLEQWAQKLWNSTVSPAQQRMSSIENWLKGKIENLMMNRGVPYQGSRDGGGMAPAGYPAGLRSAYS